MILAIDPGTTQSGWVLYDPSARRVAQAGVLPNDQVLMACYSKAAGLATEMAIERFEGMGMIVGAEVFETVHWAGRFFEKWPGPAPWRITRRQVKLHLCGSMRAKDPSVRQALIDQLGAPGTKREPGPTYGVASHAWAALAVAVTAANERRAAA